VTGERVRSKSHYLAFTTQAPSPAPPLSCLVAEIRFLGHRLSQPQRLAPLLARLPLLVALVASSGLLSVAPRLFLARPGRTGMGASASLN
jgi:hypothetical protein